MTHKIYKIQKGDTWESISEKLDITLFELRNFHNTHCELKDLIGPEIPKYLKEILYLPASEITRENLTKLKKENSFSLTLHPSLQKTTYHVAVTSYEGAKENTLSYTTHIQWLKRNLVLLTKEDFLINHKNPDLMAERLAEKLNSVLYPLELFLDNSGKISSLSNYHEIKNRWEYLKKELREYFEGKELEKFIKLNEFTISKESEVLKQLKKDWFLHSFFNGICQEYKLDENFVSQKYFPILPSVPPVKYTVETKIEDQPQKQQIKLSFIGNVSDTRNPVDLEKENYYPSFSEEQSAIPLKGTYNSWYVLDYDHYKTNCLFLECNLLLEKEQKVQVRAFHIPQQQTLIKEEGIIEIGKTQDKPNTHKKSFLLDE